MAGFHDQVAATSGGTHSPAPHSPAALRGGPGPVDAASTARALVRRLELSGVGEREAVLVGLLHGLRPVRGGWTVHEIEYLRFLRASVDGIQSSVLTSAHPDVGEAPYRRARTDRGSRQVVFRRARKAMPVNGHPPR